MSIMSASFLLNVMQVALQATEADRALALDVDMKPAGEVNLEAEEILNAYEESLRATLAAGTPLITDNYSINKHASQTVASTNRFVPTLRSLVIIPVPDVGVIYVDKLVRRGIIDKDAVENLQQVINNAVNEQQLDLSQEELINRYQQM